MTDSFHVACSEASNSHDNYGFEVTKSLPSATPHYDVTPNVNATSDSGSKWKRLLESERPILSGSWSGDFELLLLKASSCPHAYRFQMWERLCTPIPSSPKRASSFLRRTKSFHEEDELRAAIETIDKDLNRTFPHNDRFTPALKASMRKILIAFARKHTDIMYCQGMNFLCGTILLVADLSLHSHEANTSPAITRATEQGPSSEDTAEAQPSPEPHQTETQQQRQQQQQHANVESDGNKVEIVLELLEVEGGGDVGQPPRDTATASPPPSSEISWETEELDVYDDDTTLAPFEERVLSVFECFVLRVMPKGYYEGSLDGMAVDQAVIMDLIESSDPVLSAHFAKIHFLVPLVATRWLMSAFVHILPFTVTLSLWDFLFLQGSIFLFRAFLSLLHASREALLGCQDVGEAVCVMNDAAKHMHDPKFFLKPTPGMPDLTFMSLSLLRSNAHERVKQEKEKVTLRSELLDAARGTKFSFKELENLQKDFCALSNVHQHQPPHGRLSPCPPPPNPNRAMIDRPTFIKVMSRVSPLWCVNHAMCSSLFAALDRDRDGLLGFRELVMGLSVICRGSVEEKCKMLFTCFDTQEKNHLTRAEIRELFSIAISLAVSQSEHGMLSPPSSKPPLSGRSLTNSPRSVASASVSPDLPLQNNLTPTLAHDQRHSKTMKSAVGVGRHSRHATASRTFFLQRFGAEWSEGEELVEDDEDEGTPSVIVLHDPKHASSALPLESPGKVISPADQLYSTLSSNLTALLDGLVDSVFSHFDTEGKGALGFDQFSLAVCSHPLLLLCFCGIEVPLDSPTAQLQPPPTKETTPQLAPVVNSSSVRRRTLLELMSGRDDGADSDSVEVAHHPLQATPRTDNIPLPSFSLDGGGGGVMVSDQILPRRMPTLKLDELGSHSEKVAHPSVMLSTDYALARKSTAEEKVLRLGSVDLTRVTPVHKDTVAHIGNETLRLCSPRVGQDPVLIEEHDQFPPFEAPKKHRKPRECCGPGCSQQ